MLSKLARGPSGGGRGVAKSCGGVERVEAYGAVCSSGVRPLVEKFSEAQTLPALSKRESPRDRERERERATPLYFPSGGTENSRAAGGTRELINAGKGDSVL